MDLCTYEARSAGIHIIHMHNATLSNHFFSESCSQSLDFPNIECLSSKSLDSDEGIETSSLDFRFRLLHGLPHLL